MKTVVLFTAGGFVGAAVMLALVIWILSGQEEYPWPSR